MSPAEALRGTCTDLAVVFDGLKIETWNGDSVEIQRANGVVGPLPQPEEYGVGHTFQGKEAVLYDIVTALAEAGYLPHLELEAAILDALEESSKFTSAGQGASSVAYAFSMQSSLCQDCPTDDTIVITVNRNLAVSDCQSRHAATLLYTWALTFRRQSDICECVLTKDFNFESWVSIEDRSKIEQLVPDDKMSLARAIAEAIRKAGYGQEERLGIDRNVRRLLHNKFTGVSRIIAALSNGAFGPAALIQKQCMNLPKEYKLQFLQGRFSTLRLLAPKMFEVTALRTSKIFHRFFDASEVTVAKQSLTWALTCNEKQDRMSGNLTMDLRFEAWVPDEERVKILKHWQAGASAYMNDNMPNP